jgi:hypothetical protein
VATTLTASLAYVGGVGPGPYTTASFTPAAGEQLWAMCSYDVNDLLHGTVTDSRSLTWTLKSRDGGDNSGGVCVEAWYCNVPSSAAMTVTLTPSDTSSSYSSGMIVHRVAGAETTPGGATGLYFNNSGTASLPTVTITPTGTGSLVLTVGNNWTAATTPTPGSGQTLLGTYLMPTSATAWSQRLTAGTVAGTPVTLNDTAPTGQGHFRVIEIRPATGGTAATATGSLTFAGSVSPRAAATVTGGLVFGATSTASVTSTSTGGLTFSGSVGPAQFTATGGLTLSGAVAPPPLNAAGGLTFGGAGTSSTAVSAAGGLAFGGVGTPAALAAAGGSITFSGAAAVYQTPLTSHGDGRVTFVTTGAASSTTANPAAATAAVTTQNAATAATKNLDAWEAITV